MTRASKSLLYHCLRACGVRPYSSNSSARLAATLTHVQKCSMSSNIQPSQTPNNAVHRQNQYNALKQVMVKNDVSAFRQVTEKLGLKGDLRYHLTTLHVAGGRLYLCAELASRYNEIYKHINLPDSFETWHHITTLHIWLLLTRLLREGREGRLIRNCMVQAFIDDTYNKWKQVKSDTKSKADADVIDILHSQSRAAFMNYDEGIMGSDRELAGSLWRSMFNADVNVSPIDLEFMVKYVRKQVYFVNGLPEKNLLYFGIVPFLPVDGDKVRKSVIDQLREVTQAKVTM